MAKGDSPTIPDYQSLANQDYRQGLNTSLFNAGLNRVNQIGPTGSVTWSHTAPTAPGGGGVGFNPVSSTPAAGGSKVPPPGYTGPGGTPGYNVPGDDSVAPNQPTDVVPYGNPKTMTAQAGAHIPTPAEQLANKMGAPGDPGTWTQTTSLSPEQQALYDKTTSNSIGMADLAGGQLGRVGAGLDAALPNSAAPVSSVNGGQGYEGSRDAVVQAMMSRAMPGIQNDRHDLESKLLNSGIEKGTDAWNRAQFSQGQKENDFTNAALLAGGQEQSRLAGLDLAAGNFANQSAGQTFGQGLAARQVPLNELTTLRGNGTSATAPSLPNYYTTGGSSSGGSQVDAANAGYTAASNKSAQDNASANGTYGAILSALAMYMSDERLKDNIQTIGMHPIGVRRVKWTWKPESGLAGEDFGVIAQELMEVRPEAVIVGPDGYFRVDYNLIGGR